MADVAGHAKCLGLSEVVFSRLRTARWQCLLCKKCSICGELRSDVRFSSSLYLCVCVNVNTNHFHLFLNTAKDLAHQNELIG